MPEASLPAQRRASRAHWANSSFLYITAGCLISAVFVGPLLWEVLRSFEPPTGVASPPSLKVFSELGVQAYTALLTGPDNILRNILNSLIVAVGTAVLTAVVSMLAGYGFGRFRFRGSGLLFALMLLGLMVPFQAVLTPSFLELHYLHLLDSLEGLILFYTAFNLPFGVYLMRNTFLQLPGEIADAAKVDGASVLSTLTRVFRPLIMPGVATTALYAFLFGWTEFLAALTFLTSDNNFTLPVALSAVETGSHGAVNFNFLVAGAVIAMVPSVVVYIALQRYYVRGLMSGALKG